MFGLEIPELLLIAFVALILFGPKRLPELGQSLGKCIRMFKEGLRDDLKEEKPSRSAQGPSDHSA